MNEIFVSTSCIRRTVPLEERIASYKSINICAVELGSRVTTTPTALDSLKNFGILLLIHNFFPPYPETLILNLASPDEAIRRESVDFASRAITLCAENTVPFYSIHSGFVQDPVAEGKNGFAFPDNISEKDYEESFDRFLGSLEILLKKCEETGVSLLVENNVCILANKGKLLLQRPDEVARLFKEIDSPYFGLLLDTGHLKISSKTWDFGIDDFMEVAKPHVRALHINDNDGIADSHRPPSDESFVFDLLTRYNLLEAPVVIEAEFPTMEAFEKYLRFFEQKIRHINKHPLEARGE